MVYVVSEHSESKWPLSFITDISGSCLSSHWLKLQFSALTWLANWYKAEEEIQEILLGWLPLTEPSHLHFSHLSLLASLLFVHSPQRRGPPLLSLRKFERSPSWWLMLIVNITKKSQITWERGLCACLWGILLITLIIEGSLAHGVWHHTLTGILDRASGGKELSSSIESLHSASWRWLLQAPALLTCLSWWALSLSYESELTIDDAWCCFC